MLKKTGFVTAAAVLAAYAFIAFRGPQGVSALAEKRSQIRQLQEQNADLGREIQLKRDRINRLKFSQAEQELEIRKRLKLQRPGEMDFVLPDKQQH